MSHGCPALIAKLGLLLISYELFLLTLTITTVAFRYSVVAADFDFTFAHVWTISSTLACSTVPSQILFCELPIHLTLMNLAELPEIPPGMLVVRIGCRLPYQTATPTAILLMVKPRNVSHQITLSEDFRIGGKTSSNSFHDVHGNAITKSVLGTGITEILYDGIVLAPDRADDPMPPWCSRIDDPYQNWDIVRYTMRSRYCESDKLGDFACETFGHFCAGLPTAQAICNWVHYHIEYRYGSGTPSLSACDALSRGYGVCRDFAHVMVALCRALDLPARYVAGYMPLHEATDSDIGIDFHTYVEVFLNGAWHVFDPCHNKPHAGRIEIAHGMGAVDVAFATIYGCTDTVGFQVWSDPVDHAVARTGEPIILPF